MKNINYNKEEILPYLPYNLQYATLHIDVEDGYYLDPKNNVITLGGSQSNVTNILFVNYINQNYMPLLRPLKDLTAPILHEGKKVDIMGLLMNNGNYQAGDVDKYFTNFNIDKTPYWVMNILFKYHFDVFGLLDKNEALNYNDYIKK